MKVYCCPGSRYASTPKYDPSSKIWFTVSALSPLLTHVTLSSVVVVVVVVGSGGKGTKKKTTIKE